MKAMLGKLLLVAGVALSLSACSTMRAPSSADPIEGLNRATFGFNEVLDQVALRPAAKAYEAITAPEVRTCVDNFFSNLNDIQIAFNNLLQGKVKQAGSDICRFGLNTTVGIFGLVDVASELGFQKHDEDFGQTLGYWGVGNGAYFVMPFLGPSTIRDTFGRVVDSPLDPMRYHDDVSERNSALLLKVVNKRANLLPATDMVDRVALDKYAFVRDAYLARRASLVRDGAPDPEDRLIDDDEPAKSSHMQPFPFKVVSNNSRVVEPLIGAVQESTYGLPKDLQQSKRAKVELGLDSQ